MPCNVTDSCMFCMFVMHLFTKCHVLSGRHSNLRKKQNMWHLDESNWSESNNNNKNNNNLILQTKKIQQEKKKVIYNLRFRIQSIFTFFDFWRLCWVKKTEQRGVKQFVSRVMGQNFPSEFKIFPFCRHLFGLKDCNGLEWWATEHHLKTSLTTDLFFKNDSFK